MRRHLILTLAIAIALTTILSTPIGSGPTPAFAKQQFEQPEKTFDGDPEDFDPGKPNIPAPDLRQTPPSELPVSSSRIHLWLFILLRLFGWTTLVG